ncbi:MAG TPA: oligopeptide/dipeptide ABC transporter ATP-binding protein [Steroidobacteraceae bacterium]|jgi:oligopeptide transport system ATP-binding protein|nr:oligopeptide/dipeptide ABC transporter ATP-binding protein [Steroidobacteraceae bacterium]
MSGPLLLEGRDIAVRYGKKTAAFTALHSVSFTLAEGESLAVVGESGSGKSTLARAVLRLVPLAAGQVLLYGEDLATLSARELRQCRRDLQLIFQDPLASLDPRMQVGDIVAQPLRVFAPQLDAKARRDRVVSQLESVGMPASALARYPHEFSGGQAQRIGIARALISGPAVLLCDEPVSALDVSIRAQILELLESQRRQRGLALLFIAHDLAAVRFLCSRTIVLFRGEIMEEGGTAALFDAPAHPYTIALLSAALVADPRRVRGRPKLPAASTDFVASAQPDTCCAYLGRCPHAVQRCAQEKPVLREFAGGRVACHRAEEIASA